eukprot:GEMP01055609.1.p2 GENE.GEMP01055609.1~~GEMP01055609.1.p2  ORF type:complete len:171 (+),score=43.90 GEMP01055609.1:39-515(+)
MPSLFFSYAPEYHRSQQHHRQKLTEDGVERRNQLTAQYFQDIWHEEALQGFNERQAVGNRQTQQDWISERYRSATQRWKGRQLDVIAKRRAYEIAYVGKAVEKHRMREHKLGKADLFRRTLTGVYDHKARLLNSISDSALSVTDTHHKTLGAELLLPA